MRMMMRGNQQFGRARFDHAETQAGQRMILVFGESDVHLGWQAGGANRRHHAVAQIRKRVEHGGDEHIARHASDRVEMNMHRRERPGKPQRSGRGVLPVFAQHRIEIALGVELERFRAADDFEQRRVCLDDRQHRFGHVDVHDLERGGDAHDLGVLRLDPDHGLHGQPDRVFVGVHDDRNRAAVQVGRCDDVRVSLGDVDFLVQLHRGHVRATDAAGVAMGFWREAEHRDLLHEGFHVPLDETAVAPGDVGIHAGTGNVLADFLHDQHVDLVELQARHEFLGLCQQHGFAIENLFGRDNLDDCGFVRGVFHHGDTEQHILLGEDELRRFRQQFAEHVHAVGMQRGGADDLAHADGEHLDDAGFDWGAEVGMRFDARDDDDRVGFGGMLVHIYRHAVIELAQFHHVHAGLDRTSDITLGDAIAFQHFTLAFGGSATVTAHGREDERLGAERLELSDHGLGAFGYVVDAAGAATDGDDHARLDLGPHLGALELLDHGPGHAVEFLCLELLAHMHHPRQGNIESAGHVDFDAITDHFSFLHPVLFLDAADPQGLLAKNDHFTPVRPCL